MRRLDDDHRGAAFGVRAVAPHRRLYAEKRHALFGEQFLGRRQPFIGIAVETVDGLDRGDGFKQVARQRHARAGAFIAKGQLRGEDDHLGHHVHQAFLVILLLGIGGEINSIPRTVDEPLKIGE